MYHTLKAFYIIPAYFDYKEKRRISNMFILTLSPHSISIENIMNNLEFNISSLNKDVIINIGGYDTLIKLYPIVLIADIP